MKRTLLLTALLAGVSGPLFAAQKTVTLGVPGMTCAACPVTVKKAITRVEGVSKTEVDYDRRQAVVTFDDGKASVEKIIEATTNAGYPATVQGGGK